MTHVHDYHCPLWIPFSFLAGIGICWMLLILGIASNDVWNHRLLYSNRIPVVQAHHFQDILMWPKRILWLFFSFYSLIGHTMLETNLLRVEVAIKNYYGDYYAKEHNCDRVGSLHFAYTIVVLCFLVIAALFLYWEWRVTGGQCCGTNTNHSYDDDSGSGEGAHYMQFGPPAPAPRHSSQPVPVMVQMQPLPTTRPTGDNTSPRRRVSHNPDDQP